MDRKKEILEIIEEMFGFYEERKEQEVDFNISVNFRKDKEYVDIFLFDRKDNYNCNSLFPSDLKKEEVMKELRKAFNKITRTRPSIDSKIKELEKELEKLKEEKKYEAN